MKTLGIDLGTSSIGYALIDKEEKKILHLGTYIFQSAIQKEGNKEIILNAKRRDYRGKRRLHQRSKQRKSMLLECLAEHNMLPATTEELNKWLIDTAKHTFALDNKKTNTPAYPNLQAWLKQNPYELRQKALKEKITLHQLGRLLYHIIQRRGFQSNRKEGNKGDQKALYKGLHDAKNNPLSYKAGIAQTQKNLEDQNLTLGSFLYDLYPEHSTSYTKDIPRIRARYTTRQMYIQEFDRIWDYQKQYHDQLTNTKLRETLGGKKEDKIKDEKRTGILFSQRLLQSQKHLVGKCTLEPSKTRCLISHPLFEEFRAYKFANNIKVNNMPIGSKSKNAVIKKLLTTKNEISLTTLKKCIKEKGNLNYDNGRNDNKIKGSPTTAALYVIFRNKDIEKKWAILPDEQSSTSLTSEQKHSRWHALYTYDDAKRLQRHAEKHFKLSEQDALALSKLSLPQGYASFSLKALKLIVPFLKRGHLEHEAIALAGVHNAFNHHQKKQTNQQQPSLQDIIEDIKTILKKHKKNKEPDAGGYLPLIKDKLGDGYHFSQKALNKLYHHSHFTPDTTSEFWLTNKKTDKKADQKIQNLRNPNVIKTLFMLRKVYNALVKTHGRPDRIHIELARDLKRSKKEKETIDKKNKVNNTINSKVIEKLEELGKPLTPYNKLKYHLWQESNHRCPYTLDSIALEDLFNTEWEIEHIIPRSHSLDDSFNNLTLCPSSINKEKSNKTPWEFFKDNPRFLPEGHDWKSYVEHLKNKTFNTSPFIKACYAKSGTKLKPPIYSAKYHRFVNPKKASELEVMSSRYLNDTRYISREAQAQLKQVCQKIQPTKGEITSILREQWKLNHLLNTEHKNVKNRDDHRHHALDALVIACTTESNIKQLSEWRSSTDYIQQWEAWKKSPKQHTKPTCPNIKPPWGNFEQEVADELDNLLVAYHSPKKIISPISKIIRKKYVNNDGKTRYKKIRNKGIALRGSLHEETYYGKRKTYQKGGKEADRYHVRKPISEIKKRKHVQSIVDPNIRKIVEKRIQELGGYKNNKDVPPHTLYKKTYHIQNTPTQPLTEQDTIALYHHDKIKENIQLHLSLLQEEAKNTLKTKLTKVASLKEKQHIDLIIDTELKQRIRQRIHELGGYLQSKKNNQLVVPPQTFKDKENPILKKEATYLTEKDKIELYDNAQRKKTQFVQLSLLPTAPTNLPTYEKTVSKLKNEEDIECIVNKDLKERIKKRIYQLGGYVTDKVIEGQKSDTQCLIPHKTFVSFEPTLFLPNKRGDKVPIKKVRTAVESDKMRPLTPSYNKYVKPGNNYCTLIYKDTQAKQQAKVFSFFEIVCLYQTAHKNKCTLQEQIKREPDLQPIAQVSMLLRKGDFILHTKDLDRPIDWENHALLAPHLYRVIKMTEKVIHFIHHSTAQFREWKNKQYTMLGKKHKKTSNVDLYKYNPEVDRKFPLVLSSSPTKLEAIQVTIDTLGNIEQVRY